MAVTQMKHDVENADISAYAKKNLLHHYEQVMQDLNFLIVIMKGLTIEMKEKEDH
jgi:cytochrome c1